MKRRLRLLYILVLIFFPLISASSLNEIAKVELKGSEFQFVDSTQDSLGNAYIIGSFSKGAVFGDIELKTLETEQEGFASTCWGGAMHQPVEGFIAKMSSTGEWLWAENIKAYPTTIRQYIKYCDSSSIVWLKSVLVDETGVYIIGSSDAKKLEFGKFSLTAGKDVKQPSYLRVNFIAKMSHNGKWLWAKSLAPNITDIKKAVLNQNSIFILGDGALEKKVTQQNGRITKEKTYGQSVAKLDKEGNILWNSLVPENYFSERNTNLLLNSLVVDSSGNSYVAGTIGGVKVFKEPNKKNLLKFVGYFLLAKLDSEGKWVWKKSSSESPFIKSSTHLSILNDKIYFSGSFENEVSFDETKLKSVTPLEATGYYNYSEFFAEYTLSGELNKLTSFYSKGYGLNQNKIIGAVYNSPVSIFGAQELKSLTNDVFVADYDNNWNTQSFKFTDNITRWNVYKDYILGTRVIFKGTKVDIFGIVGKIGEITQLPITPNQLSLEEKKELISSSWKEISSDTKISEAELDKFVNYFESIIGENNAINEYSDSSKVKKFFIEKKIIEPFL